MSTTDPAPSTHVTIEQDDLQYLLRCCWHAWVILGELETEEEIVAGLSEAAKAVEMQTGVPRMNGEAFAARLRRAGLPTADDVTVEAVVTPEQKRLIDACFDSLDLPF